MKFETIFDLTYQRNNKDSGQKNLRCFPKCCDKGHVACGFCGNKVIVDLESDTEGHMAWIEFGLADADPTVKIGDSLSIDFIKEFKKRSREKSTNAWVQGEPSGNKFIFNKEKIGWHYGWTSNVHTSDANHVVRCLLFAKSNDDNLLTCVKICDSTTFKIYCSRRKRRHNGAVSEEDKTLLRSSKRSSSSEEAPINQLLANQTIQPTLPQLRYPSTIPYYNLPHFYASHNVANTQAQVPSLSALIQLSMMANLLPQKPQNTPAKPTNNRLS